MAQKKIKDFGIDERMKLINKTDKKYSIRSQCMLLGINRSRFYYKPVPFSEETQILMDLLDREYTIHPFYGVGKMKKYLRDMGYHVGHDRTRTLLRTMGLMAIYPKRNLSRPHPDHKIYPYLLRGVKVERANQVWCADITYIRLEKGFAYLVAIVDWYSRYVLSWRLSNTLDADFCVEALQEAIGIYGVPDIFNSDQGPQFTCKEFNNVLTSHDIRISMDGRGRCHDNIFVERLWRTVKYENVYLSGYRTIPEAREGLRCYFRFYNMERYHQTFDYDTPWKVYSDALAEAGLDKMTAHGTYHDLNASVYLGIA